VQEKETTNTRDLTDTFSVPRTGRIVALDIGTKRVGVAVCDELRVTARPVTTVERKSWKKLLSQVKQIVAKYDAAALVLGLPYNFDGSESEMSADARRLARNFALSLDTPVFLQDERVTSYEAKSRLWQRGLSEKEAEREKDAEAAAIILEDFLDRINRK
jgi:putative Holliday junction resolvase